ncbi:MAG: pitrilysin family protein, partial [Bacteroidota bacterium]
MTQLDPRLPHPRFQRTTLPGGVRVVSESIPSMRSIAMGAWVFTGSRDEAPERNGISHFIEHMVFKGTARRRMHHIAQRMESVGGYLNAFTGKEYTCYFARALDEHLHRAVETVCDLILEPQFPERELEKEKEVVLEEMKMYEDNPEDVVFDRIESVLYKNHALGRPIIGTPETVRSFSRTQLFDHLAGYYTPDRTVIAVAGHHDHDHLVRLVQDVFARVERGPHRHSREPAQDYEAGRVLERVPT